MNVESWDKIVRDGRRGGEAGPGPASGSTAAAGTRRNGRRGPRRTSKASRRTRRSTRSRRTTRCCWCTPAATRRSSTARRWSCPASAVRPRARRAARSCATRTATPTGLLRETAQRLIKRGAGEPTPTPAEAAARARQELELASQEALAKGITTFEDAGSPLATIDLMKKMVDEDEDGRAPVGDGPPGQRGRSAPKLAQYKMIDYGNGHLTVRAIKKQIDGALGSRGAWLLAPYADKPESSGLETTKIAEIDETARLAMAQRLPALRARDRRPRQPRDARHLRARLQGQPGEEGSALARRARAAHQRAGHPALRQAWA